MRVYHRQGGLQEGMRISLLEVMVIGKVEIGGKVG